MFIVAFPWAKWKFTRFEKLLVFCTSWVRYEEFPPSDSTLKNHRFRQFSASIVFCRLELSSTEFSGCFLGFRHRPLNQPLVVSGSKISCHPFHHQQNPGRSHAVAPWCYHCKTAFSKWIPRAFRCVLAISCATCALWRKCVKNGLEGGVFGFYYF